jgi:hypothetical protein
VRRRKASRPATELTVSRRRAVSQAGELKVRDATAPGNILQHDRDDCLVVALLSNLRRAKEPRLIERLSAAIERVQAARRRFP